MSLGSEFLADHAFEIEHGLPIKELIIPTHKKERGLKNMEIPTILLLGESGTGKSASMRNFEENEVALVNVAGKPLPFKGRFEEVLNSDSYRAIKKFMKECNANVIVIDDTQYLLANEFMRRSAERGYDKFTEIAVNFWDLVQYCRELPEGKIVVFMSHIERDQNGNEKMKTIGKLLDEKITVEGMFTIVLKTIVKDGNYSFQTQNSGHDTVKSPIGLFEANEIDNDLKAVVERVRAYYGLDGTKKEDDSMVLDLDELNKDYPFETEDKAENGKEKEKEPNDPPTEEKKEETPRKRRTRKERT